MKWGDIPLVENIFMNRRSFLSATGSLVAGNSLHALMPRMFATEGSPAEKPDYSLRIEQCTLGIAIKTVAYNARVPGPLLRLRQGVPVSIDVTNATANSDIVRSHASSRRLIGTRLRTWPPAPLPIVNGGTTFRFSPAVPAGCRFVSVRVNCRLITAERLMFLRKSLAFSCLKTPGRR